MAYCKAGAAEADGGRAVYLYNAHDELFAQVVAAKDAEPLHYVLESGRMRSLFRGDFDKRSVDVADAEGAWLAALQPRAGPGDGYELRVTAGADAGAVLCGLFAVNQMRSGCAAHEPPQAAGSSCAMPTVQT